MMFSHAGVDAQGGEDPEDEDAAEESDRVELAVKISYESSEYECAVCGSERISPAGPWLFLANTWDLVCDECGREHAPVLAALIDLGAAAQGYATVSDAPSLETLEVVQEE